MYHTFLHHSQTIYALFPCTVSLCTIHFYIILKRIGQSLQLCSRLCTIHFYIILKHIIISMFKQISLCTIHFYIILKLGLQGFKRKLGLCTIHFYIILKQTAGLCEASPACVPYIFTSFSNNFNSQASLLVACVPYIFTSFSNLKFKNEMPSPA